MGVVSKPLEEAIHKMACQDLSGTVSDSYQSDPLLKRLTELGSELWIDTGDLELAQSIWKRELTALTTNNTLANQVVQSGIMDEVIRDAVKRIRETDPGLSEDEMVMEIGFVINCRIALRLVDAFRVKVSVELHPSVARDLERSLAYAHRYFKVCPEFFIIKIPLTQEGYLAVRRLRQGGMPINFTLGFSVRQNYLAGRLSNPNYTNVFLGRLNAVVADNGVGDGQYVGEKVTLATQRALLELRSKGLSETRLIGASVRNGQQVADLAGLDILTIPPKAMKEFQESGKSPADLASNVQTDFSPGIHEFDSTGARFPQLWEVSSGFVNFVDSLVKQSGVDKFSGDDLVGFAEEHGIDLFYPFSDADYQKIYQDGKIPKLADWPSRIALDDLMTQSALQSFAKDQNELDSRIRSFIQG